MIQVMKKVICVIVVPVPIYAAIHMTNRGDDVLTGTTWYAKSWNILMQQGIQQGILCGTFNHVASACKGRRKLLNGNQRFCSVTVSELLGENERKMNYSFQSRNGAQIMDLHFKVSNCRTRQNDGERCAFRSVTFRVTSALTGHVNLYRVNVNPRHVCPLNQWNGVTLLWCDWHVSLGLLTV